MIRIVDLLIKLTSEAPLRLLVSLTNRPGVIVEILERSLGTMRNRTRSVHLDTMLLLRPGATRHADIPYLTSWGGRATRMVVRLCAAFLSQSGLDCGQHTGR